jgi:hypothetical protein
MPSSDYSNWAVVVQQVSTMPSASAVGRPTPATLPWPSGACFRRCRQVFSNLAEAVVIALVVAKFTRPDTVASSVRFPFFHYLPLRTPSGCSAGGRVFSCCSASKR